MRIKAILKGEIIRAKRTFPLKIKRLCRRLGIGQPAVERVKVTISESKVENFFQELGLLKYQSFILVCDEEKESILSQYEYTAFIHSLKRLLRIFLPKNMYFYSFLLPDLMSRTKDYYIRSENSRMGKGKGSNIMRIIFLEKGTKLLIGRTEDTKTLSNMMYLTTLAAKKLSIKVRVIIVDPKDNDKE